MKLRFGLNGEEPLTMKEISFKSGKKVSNIKTLQRSTLLKNLENYFLKNKNSENKFL